MIFPAIDAESMRANVTIQGYVFSAADIACTGGSFHFIWVAIAFAIPNLVSVLVSILKVLTELFYVPLELSQQQ